MTPDQRAEYTSPSRFTVMDAVPLDMFLAMLLIDGMINAEVWQCKSVIVASEEPGRIPRYFNCCDERDHEGPHECGNGSRWWWVGEEMQFEGTLYDVQADNVVRKNDAGHLVLEPDRGQAGGMWH